MEKTFYLSPEDRELLTGCLERYIEDDISESALERADSLLERLRLPVASSGR
jgi:hypothetical protein